MKALVAFVKRTIPKEYTFFRSKLKFATIVGAKVRPTSTPKNLEKCVVRNFMQEKFDGGFHMKHSCR
jgi:hypothetical protein